MISRCRGTGWDLPVFVVLDVVPATVAQKCAAGALEGLNQIPPLHATSSSSSLRIPGMSLGAEGLIQIAELLLKIGQIIALSPMLRVGIEVAKITPVPFLPIRDSSRHANNITSIESDGETRLKANDPS